MQQLVGLVGIGFTQELGIQLLHLRIIMGLAQLPALILAVQCSGALGAESVLNIVCLIGKESGADDGLTAACDQSKPPVKSSFIVG